MKGQPAPQWTWGAKGEFQERFIQSQCSAGKCNYTVIQGQMIKLQWEDMIWGEGWHNKDTDGYQRADYKWSWSESQSCTQSKFLI